MFTIIVMLIGGLGLFIYGMNLMSKAIERVAGSRLRSILKAFTKNRFFGLLAGTAFTAIIQSSSAATVMVVSFVNSGLMTLAEASGVIMGANIGTTVTALIVSFKISEFAPIFIFLGALMAFYFKKPIIRKSGDIVLGFGLLFLGISMMSSSMGDLRSIESVQKFLMNFTNPFLAVLLGLVITSVVQSSSVTVSIMVLMGAQGLIGLDICLYMILGCNIGACTSALLAGFSGTRNGKRAALIHFLFNLISSIVLFLLITFAKEAVEAVVRAVAFSDGTINSLGREIAIAHFVFKVFSVIIMYPFMNYIIKLTDILVKKKEGEEDSGEMVTHFISNTRPNPAIAIYLAIQESYRMAHMAKNNLNAAMESLYTGNVSNAEKIQETENYIDFLNIQISDYLVRINQNSLPYEDQARISGYFHVISDIERIGDYAINISEAAVQLSENNIRFSPESINELKAMMDNLNQMQDYALEMFGERNETHMEEIQRLENEVDDMERDYQLAHINRLNEGKCSAQAGIFFSDIVSELERIADHAMNIAFAVTESRKKDDQEHLAKIVLK